MKTQIDALVRQLHYNLNKRISEDPQIADLLQTIGADGMNVAREIRDQLCRWAEDPSLSQEDRSHVEDQLARLPSF